MSEMAIYGQFEEHSTNTLPENETKFLHGWNCRC